MPITIIKSTGEKVPFESEKIVRTASRAGAKPEFAKNIVEEVSRRVKDGMSTKEIYGMIMEILDREAPPIAARFNLEHALLRLGPAGFQFEKYIAELLRAYGYETRLPEILSGACITHEVDVIAEKNNRKAMLECKFRNERGIYIGIKDTMSTWSRFLDLVDGATLGKTEHLDECWLVTNTRFSSDSIKFGQCKKINLLAWNYPSEQNLAHMIDNKTVYPITVLRHLDSHTERALVDAQIMLLAQLIEEDPIKITEATGLAEEMIRHLIHEAEQIINLPQ